MIFIEGTTSHNIIEGRLKIPIKTITLSKNVMIMRGRTAEIVIDDMSSPIPSDAMEPIYPKVEFNRILNQICDKNQFDKLGLFKRSGIIYQYIPTTDDEVGSEVTITNSLITFGLGYNAATGKYRTSVSYMMMGIRVRGIEYPMFEIPSALFSSYKPVKYIQGEDADECIKDLIALIQPIISLKYKLRDIQPVIKDAIARRKRHSNLGSLYRNIEVKFFDGENSLEWDGMDKGESFEDAVIRAYNG